MSQRRRLAGIVLLAAAGLLAAACSSSSSTSSTSAAAPASTASAAVSTAAASAASSSASGQVAIGVSLTYNNTAFWSAYINYETQYAQQMHVKLLGPLLSAASASLQNQQIE